MKISVIMSEYNTSPEIFTKAIQSVLNQTFSDFELIIVNDGNPDFKKMITDFTDPRIKIIENTSNLGLPSSLNKAISQARGRYIARMDTDDISHPDRLQKQYEFIIQNPQYSVVGTSINYLTEKNELIPKIYRGQITENDLMNRIAPVHPSVLMVKDDLEAIGCYDTKNVKRCEDFVLWAKFLLNGKKIYVMEDILLDYRVELKDYQKRTLSTRKDEIRNRFIYYKRLNATPFQYLSIFKSFLAAIVPAKLIAKYHRRR
ncbi:MULTISPECIES: glycosyltransferase [Aerococcus]|uniref:Glycosyltransferase n=1 Tax=Aerococcus sanguinicola TaxID=119206 RepID=A0A5N1GML0_9LACT|nr:MULTISPECIES: glycosyltransferase [Aerococcus]KAA9302215.1 glycosyltransferase [Aerococcus sanguinicola]MDK6368356.1 glycosyltransferase [Aerococcus sp. UMB9870]MDK6679438.1 glycosyltransferase [Aerococcus sp. UMB8608]MDK6687203.1 glycosyltransferase [Aerococcus sp. UMB8623]MDK6941098.1 glycosyltransferase [Aerococcus sp. UMB8487]